MARKYIVAVDGGTQSSKVVIYDIEGTVVCEPVAVAHGMVATPLSAVLG